MLGERVGRAGWFWLGCGIYVAKPCWPQEAEVGRRVGGSLLTITADHSSRLPSDTHPHSLNRFVQL